MTINLPYPTIQNLVNGEPATAAVANRPHVQEHINVLALAGMLESSNWYRPTPTDPVSNKVLFQPGVSTRANRNGFITQLAEFESPALDPAAFGSTRYYLLSLATDGTIAVKYREVVGTGDIYTDCPAPDDNKLALCVVKVDESVTVLVNESDIWDTREFLNLGNGAGVIDGLSSLTAEFTSTQDQVLFDIDTLPAPDRFTYTTGANQLFVTSGGVMMRPGADKDYVETNDHSITFNVPRSKDEIVVIRKLEAVVSNGGITVRDEGGQVSGTTCNDLDFAGSNVRVEEVNPGSDDGKLRVVIESDNNGSAAIKTYNRGLVISNLTNGKGNELTVYSGISCLSSDKTHVFELNSNITIDGSTNGANGLDTGSLTAETWYAVWLVYNPSTIDTKAVLSTSFNAPTLTDPSLSGYTKYRRIGAAFYEGAYPIPTITPAGPKVHFDQGGVGNTAQITSWAITNAGAGSLKDFMFLYAKIYLDTEASLYKIDFYSGADLTQKIGEASSASSSGTIPVTSVNDSGMCGNITFAYNSDAMILAQWGVTAGFRLFHQVGERVKYPVIAPAAYNTDSVLAYDIFNDVKLTDKIPVTSMMADVEGLLKANNSHVFINFADDNSMEPALPYDGGDIRNTNPITSLVEVGAHPDTTTRSTNSGNVSQYPIIDRTLRYLVWQEETTETDQLVLSVTGYHDQIGNLVGSGVGATYGGGTSDSIEGNAVYSGSLAITNLGTTDPDVNLEIKGAVAALSDDFADIIVAPSNIILDISTAGAGGLDTGAAANSTWYDIYLIKNPTSQNVNGLVVVSGDAPVMPTGYTRKRRIGTCLTDGTADIVPFTQVGNLFQFKNPVNIVDDAGVLSTETEYSFDLSTVLPVSAERVEVHAGLRGKSISLTVGTQGTGVEESSLVVSGRSLVSCPDIASINFGQLNDLNIGYPNTDKTLYYRIDETLASPSYVSMKINVTGFRDSIGELVGSGLSYSGVKPIDVNQVSRIGDNTLDAGALVTSFYLNCPIKMVTSGNVRYGIVSGISSTQVSWYGGTWQSGDTLELLQVGPQQKVQNYEFAGIGDPDDDGRWDNQGTPIYNTDLLELYGKTKLIWDDAAAYPVRFRARTLTAGGSDKLHLFRNSDTTSMAEVTLATTADALVGPETEAATLISPNDQVKLCAEGTSTSKWASGTVSFVIAW